MKEYLQYIWSFRLFRWVIYFNLFVHLYSFVEFHQERFDQLTEVKILCGLNLNEGTSTGSGLDLISNARKIVPSNLKTKKRVAFTKSFNFTIQRSVEFIASNITSLPDSKIKRSSRQRAPPVS